MMGAGWCGFTQKALGEVKTLCGTEKKQYITCPATNERVRFKYYDCDQTKSRHCKGIDGFPTYSIRSSGAPKGEVHPGFMTASELVEFACRKREWGDTGAQPPPPTHTYYRPSTYYAEQGDQFVDNPPAPVHAPTHAPAAQCGA